MKNETKLQRLIRKIVKEELAKVHDEPHPFETESEKPPWTMFDEHMHESTHKPFESPQKHETLHQPDHFEQYPESLRTEELDFPPFAPKKRRKKRR